MAPKGNFLNVKFRNIDFFVFLQNQNKTVSTRGVSTKESRLYGTKNFRALKLQNKGPPTVVIILYNIFNLDISYCEEFSLNNAELTTHVPKDD